MENSELEKGYLVVDDKEEAEKILNIAQQMAAKMKKEPCCCKKVLLQLKTYEIKDAPAYINNREL